MFEISINESFDTDIDLFQEKILTSYFELLTFQAQKTTFSQEMAENEEKLFC
jgi:hypothetical protein